MSAASLRAASIRRARELRHTPRDPQTAMTFERWPERKARLARERAERAAQSEGRS